jgi:hypothetical protein
MRDEVLAGQRHLRRCRSDDPVLAGQQARHRQVVQARQQLALGQVPGRAEQHDDMISWP